jgi:hypothetical protein
MYPIQFQAFPVLLDFPNGIFYIKSETEGDKESPCFRPFWIGATPGKF